MAVELFATLTRADVLVERLRSVAPAVGPAPAAPLPTAPPAASLPPAPPTAPPAPAPYAAGLGVAAVPRILLGLGALCLLVAAVVFLAVSWSWLGVGGRTGVLVSLTVLAAAAALVLHRFELRIAAESLSVVALGLLGLDLLGADAAGWFGGLSTGAVVGVAGLTTAVAGTGLALPRPAGRPRLVAPQVVAGFGALVAWGGFAAETSHDLVAGHLMVVVAGAAAVSCRRPLVVQAWALAGAAAWVWAATAMLAFSVALSDPTLGTMWGAQGAGWSLLVSAAALLAPGAVLRHRDLTLAAGSLAAVLVTTALSLPCVDEPVAVLGLVAPRRDRRVDPGPLAAAAAAAHRRHRSGRGRVAAAARPGRGDRGGGRRPGRGDGVGPAARRAGRRPRPGHRAAAHRALGAAPAAAGGPAVAATRTRRAGRSCRLVGGGRRGRRARGGRDRGVVRRAAGGRRRGAAAGRRCGTRVRAAVRRSPGDGVRGGRPGGRDRCGGGRPAQPGRPRGRRGRRPLPSPRRRTCSAGPATWRSPAVCCWPRRRPWWCGAPVRPARSTSRSSAYPRCSSSGCWSSSARGSRSSCPRPSSRRSPRCPPWPRPPTPGPRSRCTSPSRAAWW
ncbi:hypothetical protein [Nocardioides sp. TF02-7]|uniref:hypothetical protein n=1 Tax=Nocardioides sp. TF02-7 TaxID=2917724 RepID=UPI001F05D7B8|nr:hypothetical protein [Nocardioides sp. TF02-7]UMG91798.1 hypothetical protein MF408_17340 [Nocardioides sp. TF02-7]